MVELGKIAFYFDREALPMLKFPPCRQAYWKICPLCHSLCHVLSLNRYAT